MSKPHNGDKAKSKGVPQLRSLHRFVGMDRDGNPVDNVTADNRWEFNPKKPWIKIALMDEDASIILKQVYIRNRRERPDVVVYDGLPYIVRNSNLPLPQYVLCMVDEAVDNPPPE